MEQDVAACIESMHPAVRQWFLDTLGRPTEPQARAWPVIARGEHALILAPTGSGKTLAAFLQAIDSLYRRAESGEDLSQPGGAQILYVSPLRALNNDIHRNLEIPLGGIARTAAQMGLDLPRLRSAVRTGDTPPDERRWMLREPPHILITTPESLFILLCSRARRILGTVRTVIVDEIHALFPNKRGTQLSLALEYLEELVARPVQRIGLSATQRPIEDIAAFLGGGCTQSASPDAADDRAGQPGGQWSPRSVNIIEATGRKEYDFRVMLPVADFSDLPERTVWPEIYRRVFELASEHRSTLVFVNNRTVGERVAAALNDLAGEEWCRVHHGSVSKELRLETEELLKAGELRCLVATSTLELGIDIGQIDLVVQVESPHEIARGLQRVGRAGHVPGSASKGRLIPKTRADLLEAAVIAREMLAGRIEPAKAHDNALDVLIQFITGASIGAGIGTGDLYKMILRSYNYRSLPASAFDSVMSLASGMHDTGEFLGLRPLVYWDRVGARVVASERGQRLVYTSGGTIPDTGQYGVYLEGHGAKLGELDEEFVSERRLGDRFTLGTAAWRIVELSLDKVVVAPATGGPRVPFWRGDMYGRGFVLGQAIASFLGEADLALANEAAGRAVASISGTSGFWSAWAKDAGLDESGAGVLRDYLAAQRAATGELPSDRTMIVEEFRDELAQWRVVLHSPYGARVNEPLALLLEDGLRSVGTSTPDVVVNDDTILFGFAAAEEPPLLNPATLEEHDLAERLSELVRLKPLFGRLFREAAGRALLLPRHAFGRRRTPLWLSRRRSASLLEIVERYPGFPLIHEAMREALNSVWDLPGLRQLIAELGSGEMRVRRVRREGPSPFARPVMFESVGAFMYTDDLPTAERRARYLGLDHSSLRELLGQAPLRELLDPEAMAAAVARARPGHLSSHPPSSPDELHYWLLRYGELPAGLVGDDLLPMLTQLADAGRAGVVEWAAPGGPGPVWVAAEDRGDYALLASAAVSAAGPSEAGRQLEVARRLLRRFALSHSPFTTGAAALYYGLDEQLLAEALRSLSADGHLRPGEFVPGATGEEWADAELLEEMHRRSLAKARREIEPVGASGYCSFLHRWQGLTPPSRREGVDGLAAVLEQLQGTALPAQAWESTVLPARVRDYTPAMLDTLIGSGQWRWIASGSAESMQVEFWPMGALAARRQKPSQAAAEAPSAAPGLAVDRPLGLEGLVRQVLADGAARFIQDIWQRVAVSPGEVLNTLEQMMASGQVTNDSFGPIRQFLSLGSRHRGLARSLTPTALATMGRWSLIARPELNEAERLEMMLRRYGLLAREVVVAAGDSWANLLPLLTRQEALGKVRRGYFVRGLGGLQFAQPAAVEQLRASAAAHSGDQGASDVSTRGGLLALPGDDPAQAWGEILGWPEDLVRPHPPYWLVCSEGEPVLQAEGRPWRLAVLGDHDWTAVKPALGVLFRAAAAAASGVMGQGRRIEVSHYNGEPVRRSPAEQVLAELGLVAGPQTMTLYGPVSY